jgi:hypothetical protein
MAARVISLLLSNLVIGVACPLSWPAQGNHPTQGSQTLGWVMVDGISGTSPLGLRMEAN